MIKIKEELFKNNDVNLQGTVYSEPKLINVNKTEYVSFDMAVERKSGVKDSVPVVTIPKIFGDTKIEPNSKIYVNGDCMTANHMVDGKSKLLVMVYARNLLKPFGDLDLNEVNLTGFLCKPPVYRITPLNCEITDFMLAINIGKRSYYIPCIAWGKLARIIANYKVGQTVCVSGRFQSRQYQKQLSNGSFEDRTAFEISVSKLYDLTETFDGNITLQEI